MWLAEPRGHTHFEVVGAFGVVYVALGCLISILMNDRVG